MKSILITGCNRGLGLGLVRALTKDPAGPRTIVATCRDFDRSKELLELCKSNQNLHVLQLDVRNTDTFEKFADDVKDLVQDGGLNVLFNNAGYSPKSTRINFVKAEHLMESFAVNTVGPIMLTKALLPLLKQASTANCDKPVGSGRAAVINMSSVLGSIALNTDGGLYPYRCSKAAVNMATKSLSSDLKNDGILVTSLHPGWVQTDMGGSNASMTIDASVTQIVQLIKNLNEKHNGSFYQFDGKQLEW